MEENKNLQLEGAVQEQEEKSAIDFQLIYTNLILNWKWFVLSLIVCLGLGYLYLRYATPAYQASTKVLIKDDDRLHTHSAVCTSHFLLSGWGQCWRQGISGCCAGGSLRGDDLPCPA